MAANWGQEGLPTFLRPGPPRHAVVCVCLCVWSGARAAAHASVALR